MNVNYTLTYLNPNTKKYEKIKNLTSEQARILLAEYRELGFDSEIEPLNR